MKNILILVLIFFLSNCSKPKTVLICGDHICINKTEAEQYFEKNLSIEVQVIDKKSEREIDLVELNLNEDYKNNKKITLLSKKTTNKKIKKLSSREITEIKKNIKNKKNTEKIEKRAIKDQKKNKTKKIKKRNELKQNNSAIAQKSVNKNFKETDDVCTILKKCSIDEISKYLLKQGKKKDFPDITTRQ